MIELDSEKEKRFIAFRRFLKAKNVREAKIELKDGTILSYKSEVESGSTALG